MTKARDLADNALGSKPKLIDAAGDLLYGTGSDAATRLAIGTAGQVLTVNSGATAPEWASISAGGMTLIATATPSAATTVSFTSIPTTYKQLKVVWTGVYQSSSDGFRVRINNDTGNNYAGTGVYRTNTGVAFTRIQNGTSFGDAAAYSAIPYTSISSTFSEEQAHGFLIIDNANLSSPKTLQMGSTGALDGHPIFINGAHNNSSAVTQIDFVRFSTQTITGTFRLYGIA